MIIGSRPLTTMGDESSLVKCTLHENIRDYKEEHRTEIHIHTVDSNGHAGYKKMSELTNFGDFFVHIKKDLWSCNHPTDTKLRFSRVVNRLFGVKEIYEVKYHDAIEVTTKHYLGIQKTAEIKEVKYIFTNETHSFPVRYLGELQEERGDSNAGERVVDTVESTSLIEDNQAVPGEAVSKRELHTEHSGNKKISTDGIALIVRYNYPDSSNLGDEASTAKCVEEQGIHPFPDQYALSFALQVQKHGKTFNAEILKEERHEYFIPINQEIWMCRIDGDQGEIFFRVVNEVLGRKAVENVTYHEGVNSLYRIKLGDKITIRLKEVRYFDGLTFVDKNYLGKVQLDKKHPLQRIYDDKDGEVPFVLNDNRLFRLLIGSEGYDIRVGQRWELQYDKSLQKVTCVVDSGVDYLEVYRTKFRLKAKTENKISKTYSLETPDMYTKQQFVHYLKGEISMCRDNQNEEVFYRVYNEISVLVPVHAIEFYDGVFVFAELIDGMKSKTVRVIEIKYLSLGNMRVVKYEGKVDSKASKPITMLKVSQVMRVTTEDVVWSVGHFPDINMDIVDEKSFIRHNSIPYDDNGKMKYKDNGGFELVFGQKAENIAQIGNPNGLAECTLLQDGPYVVRSAPGFLDVSTNRTFLYITEVRRSEFFKRINIDELWDCKDTSGVKFIYQRFDRVLRNTFTKNFRMYENIKFFVLAPGRHSLFNFVMIGDDSYLHIQQDKFIKIEPVKVNGRWITKYTLGNYVGQMIFKGGADSPKISGTMFLQEDEEEITRTLHYYTAELSYVVGREWIYKSELGSEGGDSLYIGTKWQRVIGNSKTQTTCERLNDVDGGMFDAFYRTRIRKADGMSSKRKRTPNQSLYDKYFSTLKQEVWQCGINTGEIRMLRTLNHFFIQKHGLVKEMLYYDGVTILLGKVHGAGLFTEVVEIKYLDENDFTVLKYEGIVRILRKDKTELSDGIDALMLSQNQVARLENYYLQKGQVHRTSISDRGVLLEIGIESDETINIPHLVCESSPDPLPAHADKYRPRIYINSVTDSHIQPHLMTIREIHRCFTSTVSLWQCMDGVDTEKKYARAVTQLTLKESCLTIATILHYDGVLIEKKPKPTIREIKFYKDTEHVKTVRIEGFVHLKQTPASAEGVGQDSQKISVTRVNYKLDEVRLHVKQIKQDSGPIIEVGSPYQATFGAKTDAVLCTRKKSHTFEERYRTEVYSNLRGRDDNDEVIKLNDDKIKVYFEVLKQELWRCDKNQEEAFLRVVNVMIALRDISRIYHPDGVKIGYQVFPDNSRSVKIIEVKYLQPDTLVPLKYEGKLTLEAIYSDKATSLFQATSQYNDYNIDLTSSDDNRQVSAADVKLWPLEVLRVHALRQEPKEGAMLPAVAYQEHSTSDNFKTGGYRVEVGSKHEAVLTVLDDDPMKCMLDQWNPTNEQKFLTKIKLHFKDDFYELDSDTILQYFNIKSIAVWICVNKEKTMLRVETRLEGVKEFYMIVKHDGIEYNKIQLEIGGGTTLNITETKYMDATDFKILKFDKPLLKIEPQYIFTPTRVVNVVMPPKSTAASTPASTPASSPESASASSTEPAKNSAVVHPTELAPPTRTCQLMNFLKTFSMGIIRK